MRTASSRIALVALTVVVGTSACRSFRGVGAEPVSTAPLPVTDATTGRLIQESLIIPEYDLSTGVGTLGGHGPSLGSSERFLAYPFVYRAGDGFHPVEKGGGGLEVPPGIAAAGRGWGIRGIFIFAHGYKPTRTFDLWSRILAPDRLKLTPLGSEEASATWERMRKMLAKQELSANDLDFMCYGCSSGAGSVPLRFTANERRTVERFFARWDPKQ